MSDATPGRSVRFALVALLCVGAVLLASGCRGELVEQETPEATAGRESCGGGECHGDTVDLKATGAHSRLGCVDCHEGADGEHADNPDEVDAAIDWRIDGCEKCHVEVAATYLYDDNKQIGPFGGSIRVPEQPKTRTFPLYAQVVAGHAFGTKGYNEEGAHAFMLQDHMAITRGKYETCLQCKSTKLAYAWLNGDPLEVSEDTTVTLTHTATTGATANVVTIPEGTVITYATDKDTREVDAKATMPDGTEYTSRPSESEDATQSFNMLWASTIAAIKETIPYGAGCNHCHDPHGTGLRVVRPAMLDAIESGGIDGEGGVNPYAEEPVPFDEASSQNRRILLCAQCHVEYTCGKSGVDGVDRDAFGWAKAGDLHELYGSQFDYAQDWRQSVIGEPLIKSQHPETELYWNSVHYEAGVACANCHMPQVRTRDGRILRSHWFTSPYKYEDAPTFAAFAAATGVDAGYNDRPCDRCHLDRMQRAVEIQTTVFERQRVVQVMLVQSSEALGALNAAKKAGTRIDEDAYAGALDAHRQAHVLWENLIVSENSMGFHNREEVTSAMDEAEKLLTDALALEKKAAGTTAE